MKKDKNKNKKKETTPRKIYTVDSDCNIHTFHEPARLDGGYAIRYGYGVRKEMSSYCFVYDNGENFSWSRTEQGALMIAKNNLKTKISDMENQIRYYEDKLKLIDSMLEESDN